MFERIKPVPSTLLTMLILNNLLVNPTKFLLEHIPELLPPMPLMQPSPL